MDKFDIDVFKVRFMKINPKMYDVMLYEKGH